MRRFTRRTLPVLVIAVGAVWCWLHAGTYLQHEDPLRKADALFVLAGTHFQRALEAADLFHEGYAPVILLSPDLEERAEVIARSRGAILPRDAEPVRTALASLGIPRSAILIGTGSVDNTASEALLLKQEARARGWHTVIVVTSKYHTRRSGFAMRRSLAGTGITVIMRASRYDQSDPARWWQHRGDVRTLWEEWPKLIAYRLGLAD